MSFERMMARSRPEPVPPVRPVPEYRAEGRTAEIYKDIKQTLGVPWVGVLMLAYAAYPTFFAELWRGLKPIVASDAYRAAVAELRALAEAGAAELGPPDLREKLATMGYAPRELDEIRAVIEIFSDGNFPYLLVATVARLLMEGGDFGAGIDAGTAEGYVAGGPVSAELVMIEAHHADPSLAALYDDLKGTLGLPFVNSDYRALARWPSYLMRAWSDLRAHPGGEIHGRMCRDIHDRVLVCAASLPNPAALTSESLQAAARADSDVGEVRDVCRLFQHLLPGLAVNVAFFRAQLGPIDGR